MTKYVVQKDAMPHYRQLTSACGLTAALMAIQPNIDFHAQTLLDKVAKKCQSIYENMGELLKTPNARHQVAAAYMILKAAKSEEVCKFLSAFDTAEYEFIHEVILFELRKRLTGKAKFTTRSLEKLVEAYQKKGSIDRGFLYEYVMRVKSDKELKLLMALFGYKFVHFIYSVDGTGAINFEHIDQILGSGLIKDDSLNTYDEIFEFMLAFLEVNFAKSMILLNTGDHWVTLQKLIIEDEKRQPEIYFLDPSTTETPLKLFDLKTSAWYYVFQPDENLRAGITPVIEKLLDVRV
jgi:hypothetical protein